MKLARKVFPLMLVLATVGCDRVTKHLAATRLENMAPQSYLSGTVRLEYVENTGAFLSIGSTLPEQGRVILLVFGVAAILIAMAFVAFRHRWSGLLLAGASLILAGGISNLIDRIAHGSVVDFISIGIGPLRTGVFNVADVAIMIGGVVIALSQL